MADVSDLLNTLFSHQRKKNITVSGWKPKGTVPPQIKYISTYKIYCDIDTFQPDQYNNTDLVTEKNTVKALGFTGVHAPFSTTPICMTGCTVDTK